jgi:hypothetical protein
LQLELTNKGPDLIAAINEMDEGKTQPRINLSKFEEFKGHNLVEL